METWKKSKTDSRLSVSNEGRVRNDVTGNVRKPSITRNGYHLIVLSNPGGKHSAVYVHHEVALAFIGERPAGCQVSHLDGDMDNNRPSNLCYETPLQNNLRKEQHGTQTKGETHGTAKLSYSDVIEIRAQRARGAKLAEIAAKFSISFQQVSRICRGLNWKTTTEQDS